jgi:release factor glutamine methyltransferase
MNLAALQTLLTPELHARVLARHRLIHAQFRQVAPEGAMIEYLGKHFIVYPTVFWPSDDSKPLVQHWSIAPGDRVLDLCTGSGVIAIMAAYAGASSVLAVDKNPAAVQATTKNAALHHFADVINARESDLFSAIAPGDTFDVITMNPPFTPHPARDRVEESTWDSDSTLHRRFFAEVRPFLKAGGRIYLSHASFGPLDLVQALATQAGFVISLIGMTHIETEPPRTYYAFQFTSSR